MPDAEIAARDGPVFLTDTQLWYKTPNVHGCARRKTLICAIADNVEFPSIIDRVRAVWPGTSAWS